MIDNFDPITVCVQCPVYCHYYCNTYNSCMLRYVLRWPDLLSGNIFRVLASESWQREQCLFPRGFCGWWRKDETKTVVGISALCFFHCCDTISWVTGGTSAHKCVCQLYPKISSRTTHTHTHPFNGSCSGTTRVSRYQKGKTNLDFTIARDSEWQWHQLGQMQVCLSLQTDNHAITPQLKFFYRPDALPAAQPTASKHCRQTEQVEKKLRK